MAEQKRCGRIVECAVCRKPKAPRGRDVPAEIFVGYCTSVTCDSYIEEPRADTLWPGESESDLSRLKERAR